jgi:hypothetical protein
MCRREALEGTGKGQQCNLAGESRRDNLIFCGRGSTCAAMDIRSRSVVAATLNLTGRGGYDGGGNARCLRPPNPN